MSAEQSEVGILKGCIKNCSIVKPYNDNNFGTDRHFRFGAKQKRPFLAQYLNSLNRSGHGKRCLAHFVLIFEAILCNKKANCRGIYVF